jgi:hypothetical protein
VFLLTEKKTKMRTKLQLFLTIFGLLTFTAESASSVTRDKKIARRGSIQTALHVPRGGGTSGGFFKKEHGAPLPTAALLQRALDLGKDFWTTRVVPALSNPEETVIQPVQEFLFQQNRAAKSVRRHRNATPSAATVALKWLRLSVLAWILAELVSDLPTEDASIADSLQVLWQKRGRPFWRRKAKPILDTLQSKMKQHNLSSRFAQYWHTAVQTPKVHWAVGSALGMIAPVATLQMACVAFVVVETNHFAKLHYAAYDDLVSYEPTDETPAWQVHLTRLDSVLETWRMSFVSVLQRPKLWLRLDESTYSSDILQRGLLCGVVIGMLLGGIKKARDE